MLELSKICKAFRGDEVETTALRDVDLKVAAGEFIAIMGPSGCGKSTLLNILGALDRPTSGTYRLLDHDVSRVSDRRLTRFRREHIGFVFQSFNLIGDLSVRENVELALRYRGVAPGERRRRAEAVLERMGVAHRAGHKPAQLSGGQQQRVAIARAVVADPNLILADEPTGNLDTRNGEEVMALLKELNATGSTLIMVTHDPLQAQQAGRIVAMRDGRIASQTMAEQAA